MKHFTRYQLQVLKQGELAKRKGTPIDKNPYLEKSDVQEYCLWAAGWNDTKITGEIE